MKEYLVTYKCQHSIIVEAENEDDALVKFYEPDNINYAIECINEEPIEVIEVETYEDMMRD